MPPASPRRILGTRGTAATIIADTPVYVWWARLVGAAGSATVSFRPGVPDVTEVIAKAFGLPETAAVAGLGCAVIAIVGLAGSAVLRGGGERGAVTLFGLILTGLFGTYLAAGHLSNAVFAALFVLALAFLLDEHRWGSALAVGSVGAAGLAHPEFLWLAVAIL